MTPARRTRDFTIATIFPLDTGNGHGLLRGVMDFVRDHPEIRVRHFGFVQSEALTPGFLQGLDADGLIVKIGTADEETLVVRHGLPAVNISGQVATPRLPTINTDDRGLGRLAAQYFHQRGHRVLGFIGNNAHRASLLRCEGFVDEARALGISAEHIWMRAHPSVGRPDVVRRSMVQWLQRLPRSAGILAFDDFEANEAAIACAEAGLRVPDDVAILGVGNNETRPDSSPVGLSAVELNTPRIGRRAAELLHRMMLGHRVPPREELIKPRRAVTRRSTDRSASDDEVVSRALDHIRENVSNTIYVDDIARTLGCSRRTLELRFRARLGTSVYAEVQRQHLEHAIDLLANPALTLAQVAEASGYEDASHLGLALRRQLGTTLRKYRAELYAPAGYSPGYFPRTTTVTKRQSSPRASMDDPHDRGSSSYIPRLTKVSTRSRSQRRA